VGAWESGFVEANGLRVHYTRTGGSGSPVVLAHGVTDDGLCWTPVAEALAAEYDVIMVDARGHGRSEAGAGGFGITELASDLAGVIAALGLRRPAVLGHSLGAATALVLAGNYSEVPGVILLEDPPAWWVPGGRPDEAERRANMRARLIELKRKTREELIADQRTELPGWSEAELGPWADAKQRVSCDVWERFTGSPAASLDWPATLDRIACPTLLITADPERGAIVTEADGEALHGLVPQLRTAHIPGAGHSIRREQFARYLEVVRGFLADVALA
jgi:N-formylmaleamate deformylase